MQVHLYYWFSVGEATLPLHHLISDFTLALVKELYRRKLNHCITSGLALPLN
jgi:hypothetical protein